MEPEEIKREIEAADHYRKFLKHLEKENE